MHGRSLVRVRFNGVNGKLQVLYYGAGLDPYCNIVDEKDMAAPAFGPIALGPTGQVLHVQDAR